jgi:hypothetical protein
MLAREITTLFEEHWGVRDWTRIRLKLSTWVRKLRVHLTLEERLVYPRLVRDPDPSIARRATQHREELTALLETLARFSPSRLANELANEDSALGLVEEAKRTFTVVATMIRVEETELYGPLVSMSSRQWPVARALDDDDADESGTR